MGIGIVRRRSLSRLATLVVALVLTCTAPAFAKLMSIPSGNPVVAVDIPGGWTTSTSKRGIEVKSPDGEIFFWIEVYLPADHDAVVGEHRRYFTKQQVATVGEGTSTATTEGTAKITATDFTATWKGKPTVLRYLEIDPGLPAGNQILLSYWASPEGDATHDVAFKKILKSLGPPR